MIHIDFTAGLHGHFLCYAINALDPEIKKVDPFTSHGTAHIPYNHKIAVCDHYSQFARPIANQQVISITANNEDCLLANLLCLSRAGDHRFDWTNIHENFYSKVKNTGFIDFVTHINKLYNIDIEKTDSVPQGILRHYLSRQFKNYQHNPIVEAIRKQQYNFPVFEFNFKVLYNKEEFVRLIVRIAEHFQLDYKIDHIWYMYLQESFLSKIKEIEENNYAYGILDNIKNKEHCSIQFNIIQQAWLNARLEMDFNCAVPIEQDEYFKTTTEIIELLV